MTRSICHFEWVKRAKNPRFKGAICTLNLWILRYAQYDKTGQYDNGFVILSVAKNPKNFKTRFEFVDTSPKAQYDKGFVILSLLQKK